MAEFLGFSKEMSLKIEAWAWLKDLGLEGCQLDEKALYPGYGGNPIFLVTTENGEKMVLKVSRNERDLSKREDPEKRKKWAKIFQARKRRERDFLQMTGERQVFGFGEKNGRSMLLLEYFPGRPMGSWKVEKGQKFFHSEPFSPEIVIQLAKYLANLHINHRSNSHTNPSIYNPNPLEHADSLPYKYDPQWRDCWDEEDNLDKINERNQTLFAQIQEKYTSLKETLEKKMAQYVQSKHFSQVSEFVPIYWDIKPQNIILLEPEDGESGQKIKIIDQELGHWDLPELDLARTIAQCDLNEENTQLLLETYQRNIADSSLNFSPERLKILLLVQKLTKIRDNYFWDREWKWNGQDCLQRLNNLEVEMEQVWQEYSLENF